MNQPSTLEGVRALVTAYDVVTRAQRVQARRAAVIETARRLVDTKYLHQGRDPRLGLDCGGLVIVSLLANGWQPKHAESLRQDYRPPDDDWMERTVASEWRKVAQDEMRTGDVLLFAWPFRTHAEHMALVDFAPDCEPTIIHAAHRYGKVCEHDLDGMWKKLLRSAWRVPMLEEA